MSEDKKPSARSKMPVIAALVAGLAGGVLISNYTMLGENLAIHGEPQSKSESEAEKEREILYWVAPMDPSYRRDGPGKSPMGMDLVPVYADSAPTGDGVTIDPTVVSNLGVRW